MKKYHAMILLVITIFLNGCNEEKISIPNNMNDSVMISHLKEPIMSFIDEDTFEVATSTLPYRITAMAKISPNSVVTSGEQVEHLHLLDLENGHISELHKSGIGVNELLYQADANLLFFANSEEHTVGILDVNSRDVIANVPVGHVPIAMTLDSTGKLLYVVNSEDATVSVLDIHAEKVVNSISIMTRPNGVFFDGEYLWIGGHGEYGTLNKYVILYDPTSGEEVDRIEVGLMPIAIYSDRSSNVVYVICHGSNTVVKLDVKERTVIDSVEVDANPYAINGDEANLYVTSIDGNTLSIINKEDFHVVKKVQLEDGPYRVILGENNE
ncbi:hypothetical protein NC661_03420 [Aquibacillus koreensis]|uniref:40-residue YVTN family beta-propeller repeat-containing protein n=1 Tax=Aquibacillus koreensis TaxID=279446 RepID=A0A9X4AGY1_9BACI|nr:hypothetical protein [Aquibacillus koreensis]MCT2536501.1 hypothetical protein [Aquibacillus koreensis]MDC3419411.1 hypothetical protein [Aquibacillus koreensis]